MKPAHKWLLRAALTALAVLLTTDRRTPVQRPEPKKPAE